MLEHTNLLLVGVQVGLLKLLAETRDRSNTAQISKMKVSDSWVAYLHSWESFPCACPNWQRTLSLVHSSASRSSDGCPCAWNSITENLTCSLHNWMEHSEDPYQTLVDPRPCSRKQGDCMLDWAVTDGCLRHCCLISGPRWRRRCEKLSSLPYLL